MEKKDLKVCIHKYYIVHLGKVSKLINKNTYSSQILAKENKNTLGIQVKWNKVLIYASYNIFEL